VAAVGDTGNAVLAAVELADYPQPVLETLSQAEHRALGVEVGVLATAIPALRGLPIKEEILRMKAAVVVAASMAAVVVEITPAVVVDRATSHC
jgi:hypothetical protein